VIKSGAGGGDMFASSTVKAKAGGAAERGCVAAITPASCRKSFASSRSARRAFK
jgi:hypothetical protein